MHKIAVLDAQLDIEVEATDKSISCGMVEDILSWVKRLNNFTFRQKITIFLYLKTKLFSSYCVYKKIVVLLHHLNL